MAEQQMIGRIDLDNRFAAKAPVQHFRGADVQIMNRTYLVIKWPATGFGRLLFYSLESPIARKS